MDLQTLKISGIETKQFDGAMKYIPKTDKGNYNFYDNKKDGGMTKAFQQFQVMKIQIGQTVVAGVKEEQKTYQDKPYTDRKIMYFSDTPGTPPQAQNATATPPNPQTGNMTLELRIDALEARVAFLENPPKTDSKLTANIGGVETPVPDCFYQDDEIQLDEIV